jgi:D-proline reductase (dithiol) PrdB
MTSGDQAMREFAAALPVPEFDTTPFTALKKPLSESRVAIVTTAALHSTDDEAFGATDTSFRTLDGSTRELRLGHWSPNFDRTGFAADLNVVYPVDRLAELEAEGVIGSVASQHISFAGNQPDDVATIRLDSGPTAAKLLLNDAVDVVLLTPV